jgi:hypothetical protein
MKLFWSWQADTPGNISRFFVRDTLIEAIEVLKTDEDIVEPSEREARDTLHLDADRQGVPGSPDLAATIFEKIEAAAVFVADVTLVGATPDGKKLINSNVAIEYGHAHHALTDRSILMVQNTHYGDRDQLPFDLRHKAGPIQYTLAPGATKAQIGAERARLKPILVAALRPYLQLKAPSRPLHAEIPSTYIKAAFFEPGEILARNHAPEPDAIEYGFAERQALYLRLIPPLARTQPLKVTDLYELALNRQIDLLVRQLYTGTADRNRFGAIVYEQHGTATVPRAFTQAFTNGELWAITTEMFAHWQGDILIPTRNVETVFGRVLENFVGLSQTVFGTGWPATVVVGGSGLTGARLGVDRDVAGLIHQDAFELRIDMTGDTVEEQRGVIESLLDQLFDLAGVRRGG